MPHDRILFFLPSLGGGGAERVAVRLLTDLDPKRYELHLALIDRSGPFLAQLPPHVTVHDFGAARFARLVPALLRLVWRLKPDTLFTSITYMNMLAGLLRPLLPPRIRLVLRETNVCERFAGRSRRRYWLCKFAYRQADTVICQTEFMRRDLAANLGVPDQRMVTIYNPLDAAGIERLAAETSSPFAGKPRGPHVVSVGSLIDVKGFDRLIAAFPALLARQPGAQLHLIGQGVLQAELAQQAHRLGIADHVHFPGFQRNPFRWLRYADLFVCSSRYDSSPNALLEATFCGCPAVVLRHPGGTEEIMGMLGLGKRVVDQLDAWDASWFAPLDERVPSRLRQLFNAGAAVDKYEEVFSGHRAPVVQRVAA